MRLFAIVLFLLSAGLGWALWQGIDLATRRLASATAEEPAMLAPDDGELTAAEQGRTSQEVASEPIPAEPRAAAPEPTQAAVAEVAAEAASARSDGPARPAEPPAGSITTADETAQPAEAPPAPAPTAAPVPDLRRVSGDQVNLREGPDAGTASLRLLSLDDPVEVLEEDRDWLRVRTEDGAEGWVAAQFLAAAPD